MDERVSSPAAAPASPLSPLPLTTYTLKLEHIDSPEPKDESNPLEDEEALEQEDFNSLEPDKEFILRFETLPILWDPKNAHYTNKYLRNKALAQLLPILRKNKPVATILDVKKKINSIRSNYRRELRKVIASKKSGVHESEVYRPKIWYFPYLHFIRKLEQRPSVQQNQPGFDEIYSKELNEISQVGTSFSSIDIPVSTTRIRKRSFKGQLLEAPHQNLPSSCTESCQSMNVSNHIVLEWADILEKLDPLQRLYAKKAINDVLFEAELGNLHKHSVKINETDPNYPSTSSPAHSSLLKSPSSPISP